jgi:MFS family permease
VKEPRTLYAAVFLRALATGMMGVILGVHLAKLQVGAALTGLIIGAGLAGAAGAALLATLAGDRWGRKRFLVGLALVSAGGGVLFSLTRDPLLLAGAAFLGMVNGMGRDRGAALILEQAILPSTTSDQGRTRVFALYNILQDVGHALGGLLAGLPAALESLGWESEAGAFRMSILLYSGLMVFTHIPSSLLLMTVPFAPNFWVAALLFLLREGLVEMDVPTRQSYVMAVVRPEERTFASGVTHLVRVGAWAVAPSFAGLFMKGVLQAAPLFVGAGLKIVYDVLLYAAFRRIKPPEETKA